MILKGIGQAADSPVTGTAAWLASACAVLGKEPPFARLLNDPYAIRFAEAISPEAPGLLRAYDDAETRRAFIDRCERELPGCLTMTCYRKPELERLARDALAAAGASQLVALGVGCDTLSLRLSRAGLRPRTFEVDRPEVVAFRSRVMERLAPDLGADIGHIREIGVDFDRQSFKERLVAAGYDPAAPTVVFAEGLLGYLQPHAVDEIFRFVAQDCGQPSRFVFSFTEGRRAGLAVRAPNSAALDAQGEPPVFDLTAAEAPAFIESRGLQVKTLITAAELAEAYRSRCDGRIRVLPYLHIAVAGT